jgi:hypothetical protein
VLILGGLNGQIASVVPKFNPYGVGLDMRGSKNKPKTRTQEIIPIPSHPDILGGVWGNTFGYPSYEREEKR